MNNIPPPIIRQQQPPLTPADGKEGKINPEMVGSNNRSTHKRLTEIDSLPDEVLLDVLFRLEAQDIYDSARFVCSKWYHMIHTRTHTSIYAHLQRSAYGLLFRSTSGDFLFMAVGESGLVEISKLSYKPRYSLETSCNGLLLEKEIYTNNFYVSNPCTRQIFALPPIFDYKLVYEVIAIAYAAASMEYKVVIIARWGKRMCRILTIGVDNSWRTLGSSLETKEYFRATLITEGFLHFYHEASNEVLTLNVETEIITETTCPEPKWYVGNIFLSTGRYLTLLRQCGEFCWEVWEMKPKIDYQWRKVWDISLEALQCSTFQRFGINRHINLFPIGWLKYPEVLAFSVTRQFSQMLVFNFLTQDIVTIELPRTYYLPLVHKNSLVWFDGL